MAQPSPTTTVTNPRVAKLIELETRGVIKPEHEEELNVYRAQGLAPKKASNSLTQSQGQSTGFYARALSANGLFANSGVADEPRGVVGQGLANIGPAGIVNYMTSPERQKAEQAKNDFIAATLRYESGAAIGKDEFTRQDQIFFPQPGDSPGVIAQKAKAREVAISGLKESAGPGEPSAEKAANGSAAPVAAAAPSTQPADPNAPAPGATVTTPILEAGSSNILGTPSTGPRPTIDIHDETAAQTPEFRAGLAKLLANPSVGADEIRDYWSKNAGGAPAPATPAEAEKIAPLAVERGKNGVTDRIDAVARGLADVPSMGFADEIAAAGRTVFGDKTMAENLAAERGVDEYDQQNHGVLRFMGQLGGGAVLPFGEARTPGQLAKVGGAYGAAYGFGSGTGGLGDRFIHAGVGGASGAATGAAFGKLSELFNARPGPSGPPTTGNAVADAAARRNIPVVAADVAPGARGVTGFLESMPFAGGVVRRRLAAGNDAIEQQVGNLADGVSVPDRISVGEGVQGAAKSWAPRASDIGARLYEKIPISGRSRAVLDKTRAALGELVQGMESNPELSKIWVDNPRLKATLDALTSKDVLVEQPIVGGGKGQPFNAIQGGEISWGDLKRLRTIVGEIAGRPSLGSDGNQVAAMKKLYGALSGDMETTALKNGPAAYRAFERANGFWRDKETRINDVLSKVVGPDPTRPISGEAVMSQIERWASQRSGSSSRLQDLFSSLGRDERQQVAGSIAESLGRKSPDAQFSSQTFFTQVSKMSNRSRIAIFGRSAAEALSDLATVAEGRAGTISKLNNTGSGRVSNYLQTVKGMMGLGGGAGLGAAAGIGAPTGAALTAAALGAGNISARLLTNPAVARWAAQGLRVSTAQGVRNSLDRLGQIASSNPAIRTEVLNLQSALAKAVNDNAPMMAKAAASNGEGPGNEQ